MPSLWRNRDFMLLWSGQMVSVLGSRVSSIALPLLVLALTRSPSAAGLVGFAGTLPYLLLQLPAGAFVDRWQRKRTMIVCDGVRLLALGSLPLAAALAKLTLPHIVIVAFAEGACFVFFTLAEESALPRIVSRDQLPAAIAQNEAKTRGAELAGQPIGGLLFGMDRMLPFVVDAASYAASIVALLAIKAPLQVNEPRASRPLRDVPGEIREGFGWLWGQPLLRASALLVAGSNFIFQALVLVVIVLATERGASPAVVGTVLGLVGAGGLLGAFVSPWLQRRIPAKAVIIEVNWLWALLLPLFAVVPQPLALGVVYGLMALVGPLWNVVLGAYQLSLTPDALMGRVNSVTLLLAWGSIPLGSLVAGILLESLGAVATTWVLSAGMIAIALTANLVPAVRRAPPLEALTPACSPVA